MPTYEYKCKTCGYVFEAFQSMSDEPLKVCPECGKEVRRIINGGSGIIFKGSGFYVTDKAGAGKNPASKPVKKATETTAAAPAVAPAKTETKSGPEKAAG